MPKRMVGNLIAGRPLISTSRDVTVRAACCLMAEKRIGALLVPDQQRLARIFTECDAPNKVLAGDLDPDKTPVGSVMVDDPLPIRADKPLAYALHMMAEGGFRHVPVVDEQGLPLGMVSARDALGQDLVDLERDMRRL